MKHFEAEEIARFAEGKVKDSEQETFISHLAECGECFKAYTDTLKFIEEEYKKRFTLKFPNLEKIKIALHRFWQDIRTQFKNKKPVLVPTFAALIIILLIGPFVLTELHNRKIEKAQIQQIVQDIENMSKRDFAPSGDKISAAVRSGIFMEYLSLVVNTGNNEELKTRISQMLKNELKTVFKNETDSLSRDLENLKRKNFKAVNQRIRDLIEKQSLSQLFRFGSFVEHSILSTFENKTPNQEDIEKYQRISSKYNLPQGVSRELAKLKKTDNVEESRNICIAIKEIFLE